MFTKASTDNIFEYANNIFKYNLNTILGEQQANQMKSDISVGLSYVLKGSLTNSIMGNDGGYSFVGQNMAAKTIKFDNLETSYTISVPLSQNLTATFGTSNMTVQLPTDAANPCLNVEACQITTVVFD